MTEAGRLAIFVGDIFKVLMDLGMPPIPSILYDSCMTGDILEAVGTIL
jgi:hypothetical protein